MSPRLKKYKRSTFVKITLLLHGKKRRGQHNVRRKYIVQMEQNNKASVPSSKQYDKLVLEGKFARKKVTVCIVL